MSNASIIATMSLDFKIISIMGILLSGCNLSSQELSEFANSSIDTRPTQVYKCNDYEFSAYEDSDKITLYLPDRTVALNRVRAASGAKYQNSNLLFWNKGDRALLEVGDKTYSCQRNLQREPRI